MRIPPGISRPLRQQGFTLMELTVIIVLLGLVSAVIVSALGPITSAPTAQADALAAHLRYTQSRAIKSGDEWGLTCQSNACWLYEGTDSASTAVALPGETNTTIDLNSKGAASSNFNIYFDRFGIPYSETSGTKLVSNLTITVSAASDASLSRSITLTAETGYVP